VTNAELAKPIPQDLVYSTAREVRKSFAAMQIRQHHHAQPLSRWESATMGRGSSKLCCDAQKITKSNRQG
jgi:hypothetical protein